MRSTAKTLKVLIVEDSPADLNMTLECLESLKISAYEYVESLDGMKKQLETTKFDLILLDLGLPESKGIETVVETKKALESKNLDTPIIVLTGTKDFAISKTTLKRGACDYLIKGEFGPSELQRAISFATLTDSNPKRPTTIFGKLLRT